MKTTPLHEAGHALLYFLHGGKQVYCQLKKGHTVAHWQGETRCYDSLNETQPQRLQRLLAGEIAALFRYTRRDTITKRFSAYIENNLFYPIFDCFFSYFKGDSALTPPEEISDSAYIVKRFWSTDYHQAYVICHNIHPDKFKDFFIAEARNTFLLLEEKRDLLFALAKAIDNTHGETIELSSVFNTYTHTSTHIENKEKTGCRQ